MYNIFLFLLIILPGALAISLVLWIVVFLLAGVVIEGIKDFFAREEE